MKKSYLFIVLVILALVVLGVLFFSHGTFMTSNTSIQDAGKLDNHNDIWNLSNTSESSLTRTAEDSIFSRNGNNWDKLGTEIPTNSRVQFDVLQSNGKLGNFFFSLEKTNHTYLFGNGLNLINGSLNKWHHISIDVYPDHYIFSGNNVTKKVKYSNANESKVIFNFWLSGNITSLKFKNFEVSPI